MKVWIDDIRPAPEGYDWCKSVIEFKQYIEYVEYVKNMYKDKGVSSLYNDELEIELIDIDHDAGEYYGYGGDYINILNWLEETGRNYPIKIHSMNPVGIQNMRRIIQKNGWKEVF